MPTETPSTYLILYRYCTYNLQNDYQDLFRQRRRQKCEKNSFCNIYTIVAILKSMAGNRVGGYLVNTQLYTKLPFQDLTRVVQ